MLIDVFAALYMYVLFGVYICACTGTSGITIRDFDESSNFSFYLGYGNYTIICKISDSKGAITTTYIDVVTSINNEIVAAEDVMDLTDNFLQSYLFNASATPSVDQVASVVTAAISMFNYAGDLATITTTTANETQNTTAIINQLKNRREKIVNHSIDNVFGNLSEDETSLSILQTESQLLNVIVNNFEQINSETGKTTMIEFGNILNGVNNIGSSSSFDTALNDDTADALVSGILNVGNAFVNENEINSSIVISSIDIGLNLLLLFKLNNSIPGESGYTYETNDGSIVNGMKQSVDNLNDNNDNICGSDYLYYNQIGNIMSDENINEFNCLFSLQSSYLYQNVPGDLSVSNVISFEFTLVPDSIDYDVEEIIYDTLNSDSNTTGRRRLTVSDVINDTGM